MNIARGLIAVGVTVGVTGVIGVLAWTALWLGEPDRTTRQVRLVLGLLLFIILSGVFLVGATSNG